MGPIQRMTYWLIYLLSIPLATSSSATTTSMLASNSALAIPWNKHNGSPQTIVGVAIAGGIVSGFVRLAASFFSFDNGSDNHEVF
ncbi:hypothetical protein V8C43DRAFT_51172 [Trichoderma afarasin]